MKGRRVSCLERAAACKNQFHRECVRILVQPHGKYLCRIVPLLGKGREINYYTIVVTMQLPVNNKEQRFMRVPCRWLCMQQWNMSRYIQSTVALQQLQCFLHGPWRSVTSRTFQSFNETMLIWFRILPPYFSQSKEATEREPSLK
jgi:hypothetical protein